MSRTSSDLAWKATGLSSKAKSVLLALANAQNEKTGRCYPSVERLAKDVVCSSATVKRALAELRGKGWIASTPKGRRNSAGGRLANDYTLFLKGKLSPNPTETHHTLKTHSDPLPEEVKAHGAPSIGKNLNQEEQQEEKSKKEKQGESLNNEDKSKTEPGSTTPSPIALAPSPAGDTLTLAAHSTTQVVPPTSSMKHQALPLLWRTECAKVGWTAKLDKAETKALYSVRDLATGPAQVFALIPFVVARWSSFVAEVSLSKGVWDAKCPQKPDPVFLAKHWDVAVSMYNEYAKKMAAWTPNGKTSIAMNPGEW